MLLFIVLLVNVAFGAGFDCNFEKDYCGGIQRKDDKFDWSRRKTNTPSGGTGPPGGFGGGYYTYIEASSPRKPNDNAKLEFRPPLGNAATCISFYYHMWGEHVGRLIVHVNGKQEFVKSGKQANKWIKADIKVQERARSVIFEGVRGGNWQGDIAIDKLKIENCGGGGGGGGGEGGGGGGGGGVGGGGGGNGCGATPPPPQTPAPPQGGCGVRPSTRIVGGNAAKHGDWPWQAMLRSSFGFPYCGGTLVHPQWVVTATHCVQGKSPSSVFVR